MRFVLLVLLLLSCAPKRPLDPAPDAVVEHWSGSFEVSGVVVDFAVHLARADAGWTGTIDIPVQGVTGAALSEVADDGSELRFTLAVPGAPARFVLHHDGAAAVGTLSQGPAEIPVSMTQVEADAPVGPRRPQTPAPPFPYAAHEVTYASGDIQVAGTLTVPEGAGPHPAVLLITGSGAQDRDESLLGHKPFLVLADHLSRRGIAVLRVDDRGVGGTGGSLADATADVLASDVLAGVAWLRARPEVDPARVGVVGHSEGGILGPMAAARSPDVAFVVMLAGTGLPGRDILLLQGRAMLRAAGADDAALEEVRRLQIAVFDAQAEERRGAVRALVEAQLRASNTPIPDEAALGAMVDGGVAQLSSGWFQSFVALDPRPALREVKVPVLALVGSLDFQVPPAENVPEIRAALAGSPDATVEELAGLNHLFQHATTGMLDEYAAIEETMAPEVLDRVTGWIRAHAGL